MIHVVYTLSVTLVVVLEFDMVSIILHIFAFRVVCHIHELKIYQMCESSNQRVYTIRTTTSFKKMYTGKMPDLNVIHHLTEIYFPKQRNCTR